MRIEVVYSPAPRAVDCVTLELAEGCTVETAVRASGLLERHAGIDLARQRVGVWGRVGAIDAVLRDGDRVEVLTAAQGG